MKRCTCLSHKRCTQASDEPPSSGYLCRGSGGYLPTSGSPSALPCPQPPLGIEPNTVNLKDWRPTTELSRLVVNTSAANTSVATPQWSAMRKQQDTIRDPGARGVVVSHPYSKLDEERKRERDANPMAPYAGNSSVGRALDT